LAALRFAGQLVCYSSAGGAGEQGAQMSTDQTLAEQIAHQLRRDILRGKLAPGDSIKERDNAAEMGVSRTPMREAIRILAQEGLVILRPARSPIVANPSLKEVMDWIDVLRVLELRSGQLACVHASDEELAKIAAIQGELEAKHQELDTVDLFEIDMQFHIEIAKASGNVALAETHNAFLARLWRARYLSAMKRRSRDRVLRQHNAILQALMARDEAAVTEEMASHLEYLITDIRDHFEKEEAKAQLGG
jgi:DNA-binding GntR family transcriptional regulator